VHADGRVELAREGAVVDLGGIAKGFALDRMRPLLLERGIESALLEFGQSSTLAVGAPPGSGGWRLLVRGPEEDVLGLVTLTDRALSISSSFGHSVEIGGRRYGHVIDPRTGQPLTRPLQALIAAPDATLAEALSKALLILPPDVGVALVAAQRGCEGMLVDAEGRRWKTSGWDRATRWAPGLPAAASSGGAVAPIEGAWRPRI
jgi:thiamine biosynthesis lipoprotein